MSVTALLEILNRMTDVHEMLLSLARDKKEALIHNQVDVLNQIVHKEMQIAKQLADFENQRIEAVNRILVQRGFRPNPQVTISDMVKIVFKAEDKQALLNAQRTLVKVIDQLKTTNELNQKLIEQSLAFINYSYDLLLGPPEDDVVYHNPSNSYKGGQRQGFFDTKA